MGMSTHIVGFVPPDEKFLAMQQVWQSCTDAGVEVPDEVEEFFNYGKPDPNGMEDYIDSHPSVKEWDDGDMRQGYEIDISKLPPNVKIIRVYNSW